MSVKVRSWKGQRGVYGVFIDHKGQRVAKKVGDRQAAERVKRELELEFARGDFKLPQRGLTFKDLAVEWIAKYSATRAVSPTTMANYVSFIHHHLIPYFGEMPVADVDEAQIEAFIAEKRGPKGSVRFPGQPLADSALRVGRIALMLILDRAVRIHRVLTVNPARGLRLPRFGRPDDAEHVDPFRGDELRAILVVAWDVDRMFATFLWVWVQSGMRIGEVSALQNQDLDLVAGKAVVRRTYSKLGLGPTKTRQTRVVSFLHPIAQDTLEWRPGVTEESRRVLAKLKTLPVQSLAPEAFVFGVEKPWPRWWINDRWRKVLHVAKVRYRNPEQLRHTFASTLLSRNAPMLYVQRQGGWRSAAVLLRVYAQWIPENFDDVATAPQPSATQAQPLDLGPAQKCQE